jgi:hypothetical protein
MDLVCKDKIYHGFKITIRIFRINLRNMQSNSDTLVTVLNASLIHEIHIAKTLLSSYGIHSFVFDENLNSIIGTAYVEGFKLKVNSSDLEKAKLILSSVAGDSN